MRHRSFVPVSIENYPGYVHRCPLGSFKNYFSHQQYSCDDVETYTNMYREANVSRLNISTSKYSSMWYTFQIFFLIEDFAIQGIQACGTRAEQRVLSIPRHQSGHSLTGDEISYNLNKLAA